MRRYVSGVCAAAAASVVLSTVGVTGASASGAAPRAPALADTVLCSGASYSTCTNAGYTDHGYGANSGNSYWQIDPGHNCTNYAAYVEQTVNGAPTPSYSARQRLPVGTECQCSRCASERHRRQGLGRLVEPVRRARLAWPCGLRRVLHVHQYHGLGGCRLQVAPSTGG